MDLLREIGPILGFVAFGGLAVLAFLTFQQARHLRRLREWAGRQPERAAAEAEAIAERAGEVTIPSIREEENGPSRADRLRGSASVQYDELDRRSPVDPRILAGGLLAVVIGVGVATSGFGLVGDSSSDGEAETAAPGGAAPKVEVAVLNGTAPEVGGVGVEGVANRASKLVKAIEDPVYKVGAVETAGSFPSSVVMFKDGSKAEAKELAAALGEALGETDVDLMTEDIQSLAKGADLALVVGQDDQGIE